MDVNPTRHLAVPPRHPIHALTGIRFVAAFAVFFHHMLGRLGITWFNAPLGDAGVTFFFVLSGFILTYVYADCADRPGRLSRWSDLPRFYFTRWARIWPLHVVTLAIYVFCFSNLTHIINNAVPARKLVANLFLIHSWVPSYGWAFSYNGVSWSISTEAFFYLMFPLIVIGRGRFWIKYCLATIGIVGYVTAVYLMADTIAQTGWASVYPLVHCFPFVRLFEFMTGMAVGYLFLARPQLATAQRSFVKDSLIEFAAIGLLAAYYYWQYAFPRTINWPPMFFTLQAKVGPVLFYALLIFLFSHTRGVIVRAMGSRVMVYLGEISFAFYMIHLIVIQLLERQPFQPLPMYYGGLMAAAFVLSTAAAALLYHLVEVPTKSILLAGYNRGFLASFKQIFQEVKTNLRRPLIWISLAAIGLTLLLLQSWTLDGLEDQRGKDVIANTKLFDQPIHFANEAVLFGAVSRQNGETLEIELAWIKKRATGRMRLLEIYSSKEELRHSLRDQDSVFAQTLAGELFVETISVPLKKFTGEDRLCMAFFSREEKLAFISGGPRSFFNRRLDLFTTPAGQGGKLE